MGLNYFFRRYAVSNRSFFEVIPDDLLIIILRKVLPLSDNSLVLKYRQFSRVAPFLLRTILFSDDSTSDRDSSIVRISTKDYGIESNMNICSSVFDTLEIASPRIFSESDAHVLKVWCKPECTLRIMFYSNSGVMLEENISPVLKHLGSSFTCLKIDRPLHGIDENLYENTKNIRAMLSNYSFNNLKSFHYTGQDMAPILGTFLWKKLSVHLQEISITIRKGNKWCELLAQIGTHCRNLKIINMDNPFDDINMTEEKYVAFLTTYGATLHRAKLVFSQFINQPAWRNKQVLSKLLNSCPNFRCNWQECDEELPNFHRMNTLGKHIESLRIHAFQRNRLQKHLVLRNCTSLKNLIISSDPSSLSGELFQDIFADFPSGYNCLQSLICYNIIHTQLYFDVLISSNISYLKELKLYSLVMSSHVLNNLEKFIRSNRQLESIFLVEHESRESGDVNTLDIVTQVVRAAEKCTNLANLDVYFVDRISPQIEEIENCCNRLRLYLVVYTFGFSDKEVRSPIRNK